MGQQLSIAASATVSAQHRTENVYTQYEGDASACSDEAHLALQGVVRLLLVERCR